MTSPKLIIILSSFITSYIIITRSHHDKTIFLQFLWNLLWSTFICNSLPTS